MVKILIYVNLNFFIFNIKVIINNLYVIREVVDSSNESDNMIMAITPIPVY